MIFLKRDRDSKSQLEQLGTNEIQIGSQAGFLIDGALKSSVSTNQIGPIIILKTLLST